MGKMGYIHYLCEADNRKELIEEVGSIEMADSLLASHREIRIAQEMIKMWDGLEENNISFNELNEMVNNSIKEIDKDK